MRFVLFVDVAKFVELASGDRNPLHLAVRVDIEAVEIFLFAIVNEINLVFSKLLQVEVVQLRRGLHILYCPFCILDAIRLINFLLLFFFLLWFDHAGMNDRELWLEDKVLCGE